MPSVAIVGASTHREKFGNKSVRAHAKQGWTVYPVHPTAGEIEGHRAYPSLGDVPAPLDRISIYLPPEVGLDLLPEIAAVEHRELFLNPGAESALLIERARGLGLEARVACSIVDIGESPSAHP